MKTEIKSEIKKFIQTPKEGDKIKVYTDHGRDCYYAIVKRIEIGNDKEESIGKKREIAIVSKTDMIFTLNECKYMLDESKVRIE